MSKTGLLWEDKQSAYMSHGNLCPLSPQAVGIWCLVLLLWIQHMIAWLHTPRWAESVRVKRSCSLCFRHYQLAKKPALNRRMLRKVNRWTQATNVYDRSKLFKSLETLLQAGYKQYPTCTNLTYKTESWACDKSNKLQFQTSFLISPVNTQLLTHCFRLWLAFTVGFNPVISQMDCFAWGTPSISVGGFHFAVWLSL